MAEITVTDTSGEAATIRQEEVYRRSKFLVTISTNFKPRTNGQSFGMAESLRTGIRQLTAKDQIPALFEFADGSWRDVASVDVQFNVELGRHRNGGRIHSHMIIDVKHQAKLRLDLAYIRHQLPALIPDERIQKIYMDVRLLPSDTAVEHYLRKPGYDPEVEARPHTDNNNADGDLDELTSGIGKLSV